MGQTPHFWVGWLQADHTLLLADLRAAAPSQSQRNGNPDNPHQPPPRGHRAAFSVHSPCNRVSCAGVASCNWGLGIVPPAAAATADAPKLRGHLTMISRPTLRAVE